MAQSNSDLRRVINDAKRRQEEVMPEGGNTSSGGTPFKSLPRKQRKAAYTEVFMMKKVVRSAMRKCGAVGKRVQKEKKNNTETNSPNYNL